MGKRSRSESDSDEPSKRSRTDSESEDEEEKAYEIRKTHRVVARKYGAEEIGYSAVVTSKKLEGKNLNDISDQLVNMFDEMLEEAGRNYGPDDRVRVAIEQDQLDQPIFIHAQPRHNVTGETIMNR